MKISKLIVILLLILTSCIKNNKVVLPEADNNTFHNYTKQEIDEIMNNYSRDNNIGIIIENNKYIMPEYISEENIILYFSIISKIEDAFFHNTHYKNYRGIRKNIFYVDKQILIIDTKYDGGDIYMTDGGIGSYLFHLRYEFLEQYIQSKNTWPIFIYKVYEHNLDFITDYLIDNEYEILDSEICFIINTNHEKYKLFKFFEFLFQSVRLNINNYNNAEESDNIVRIEIINRISDVLIHNLKIMEYPIPNIYNEINNDMKIIIEDWNKKNEILE